AAYIHHFIGIDELDKLLQTRIAFFEGQKTDAVRWTALSLLLSSILAFLITFNIIKRVKSFNSTTKIISGGDLTARVRMNSGDEIGELANSFDSMTDNIVALNSEIAAKNEELKGINQNLEKIVEERTSTIKVILDNVKFGFFLIDRSLNIQEGFSKSCIDLLGKNLKSGTPILNALGVAGTRNAPMVGEFLNQAFEDFLPEEMTLQQLPSRVQLGEKILSLISSPVRDQNNAVKSILFTVIDATNLEKMEKENERHKVLVRLLKEFDSFKDFLDETKTRLGMCRNFVKQNDQTKVRGELHTMKGNTAAYDMVDIAKLIHAIEDGPKVESADIDRIEAAFVGFLEHNYDVLQLGWNGEAEESYSVSKGDLAAVINRVKTSGGADLKAITELTHWATTIQFKTARSLVGALPDYAERLASRLGKDCKVRIDGGDVRMDSEIMRPIMQSMVHLVRNAIDHGIELPHLRSGKAEQGIVEIACSENTKEWLVVIKDDGRGIDTDAIVARAITTGALTKEKAAALKPDDRCRLVFLNGVTTSESISDISGRGVGMGAVEASVIEAGGQLRISSTRGIGTTVTIAVPKLSNMVKRKAA
ncbi:MAG: ATP-binding protein, partial [Proteobacteria bacterium]|nr:ATP-binding protein [Pseudomonadota bacterium]